MAIGDGAVRGGEVWVDDFDLAMKKHLLATERSFALSGETTSRPFFVTEIAGVVGDKSFHGAIPVVFGNPQDVLTPFVLPCVVVVRDDEIEEDGRRWEGWNLAYRAPTDAAKAAGPVTAGNGTKGYTEYESREGARAYNLRYTVYGRGRTDAEASRMGRHFFRLLPKYGTIEVVDSERAVRQYSIHVESFRRSTDLEDVLVRRPAWAFTVVIQGELDHALPRATKSYRIPVLTVDPS